MVGVLQKDFSEIRAVKGDFHGFCQFSMFDDVMEVLKWVQGLNWDHPFMQKLKIDVEKKLQLFVDRERKERDKHKKGVSKTTLERNAILGRELGKLYKEVMKEEDLALLDGDGSSGGRKMLKPRDGFGFIPSYYAIERKKEQRIRLLIESPEIIPSYEKVKFESDNKDIVLEKESCLVGDGEYLNEEEIYIHRIAVIGNKAGAEGEITATTKNKLGEEYVAKAQIVIKEIENYPPDGFSFVPEEYRVKIEKTTKLLLKIDGDLINGDNMKVAITSNNKYIRVDTPELTISQEKGIIEKSVVVKGTRIGELGAVTAVDLDDPSRKAEAQVKVIPSKERSSPEGFEIKHEDTPNWIQRSLCDGNMIYIFTKEPTVLTI